MAEDTHGMGIPLPPDATKIHEFPGVTRLAMERVAEILAGGITEGQQAAVDALAEAAVAAELDARDVLDGATRTAIDDSVGGILVDDDRRTWVDIAADGGPTAYATKKILAKISAGLTPAGSFDTADDSVGGITDATDRRTWVDIAAHGGPTTYAAAKIAAALGTTAKHAYADKIVTWGDSMTAGAGGIVPTYPTILATLTGLEVINAGSGGETSVTIVARTNALPLLAIPAGGSIPAAGAVNITLEPINGQMPAPLLQAYAGYTIGTFAGVPGTLGRNVTTGVYTFTRAADGAAVPVSRPAAFYSDDAENRRQAINVYMLGANGPDHPRPLNDTRAAVDYLTGADPRYLVVSRPNGTDAEDADYFNEFGRRYFSVRRYMVDYGLADAGITPTAGDETDIAAGKVPGSLRIDGIHWTAAGYDIMAKLVYNRLKELRFI